MDSAYEAVSAIAGWDGYNARKYAMNRPGFSGVTCPGFCGVLGFGGAKKANHAFL
ncbi:hypothetical protein BKA04_001290 [Cryobacterium mesophilum]|nr:hypothetical protein [Terrimesophilobacter mesophilus]